MEALTTEAEPIENFPAHSIVDFLEIARRASKQYEKCDEAYKELSALLDGNLWIERNDD